MNLSDVALELLRKLHSDRQRGYYPKPPATPARAELKRAGLIETAKRSLSSNDRRPYWRPTEAGIILLESINGKA